MFANMLLNCFADVREFCIRMYQEGFCPDREYSDQIFTLRQVLEHRYNYQQLSVTELSLRDAAVYRFIDSFEFSVEFNPHT